MIEFDLIDDSQTIDVNLTDNSDTIEVDLIKEIDRYDDLKGRPSINDVTLTGNKTLSELGIQPEGDYATNTYVNTELNKKVDKVTGKGLSTNDFTNTYKATVDNNTSARHTHSNKSVIDGISSTNISNWNNKAEVSDIPDVSQFITKDVSNLTYYTLKTNTGSLIDLEINTTNYVVTLSLKDQDGTVISTDSIDLPLESVVVGGSYDSVNQKIILTLENGNTVDIPVGALISGLQTEITSSNKLASDLVDDNNSGNKFVTTSEKTTWNNKYDKPNGGIPKTDLANEVQTSLGKADTALQEHQDLTDYVKNTDYATSSVAGVLKPSAALLVNSSNGNAYCEERTYAQYQNSGGTAFISKGTLENVITGKDLITSSYHDSTKQNVTDESLNTVNKDIVPAINEVNSIAKGANQAVGFSNYQTMITSFNSLSEDEYQMGQNIYIVTLNVPDLWISGVESTSVTYTYTTDDAFINTMSTDGYVQVGYYKISMLETQKVDLTNYVQNTDYATSSVGGVIKVDSFYGLDDTSDGGKLRGQSFSYADYQRKNNFTIIGKGTLENVISGKNLINSTGLQNLCIDTSSPTPNFGNMTPIATYEYDISDKSYHPVYTLPNTGLSYSDTNIVVAYRITATGTNIYSSSDIIDVWHNPCSYPLTTVMHRTLSTSASTTGIQYLRAVYPKSTYLNDSNYPLGQEIVAYNTTIRHIKIEVFKTPLNIIWKTTADSSIYIDSTHNANNVMTLYNIRGWIYRQPQSFVASSAGYANYVDSYECATIGSAAIKAGNAGLPSGHFAYLADDGLVYDISNTTKNISPVFKKVGVLNNAVNKNTAITSTYFRTVMQLSTAAIGNIPHATLSLGNRVFLRCTMDANGYIHSDNYLDVTMSPGYTWLPFGVATASNAINMDTRNQNFYTLNANGKLTHIDGIEIATGS